MLTVTIRFDPKANREPSTVKLNGYNVLTSRAAIAARDVSAGRAATATITDGIESYRVVKNNARKI